MDTISHNDMCKVIELMQECTDFCYHSVKKNLLKFEHYEALEKWESYAEKYGKSDSNSAYEIIADKLSEESNTIKEFLVAYLFLFDVASEKTMDKNVDYIK